MENYYIITKHQAKQLGRIDYAKGKRFDPFVGEQTNGFYVVSEELYNEIKTRPEFENVSFANTKKTNTLNLRTNNINTKMATNADWKNLSQDFFYSSLLPKAMQNATPNAYSTFLKVLTDGENNYASENAFLATFGMLGVTWTTAEKAEINTILTNNNFTVQVS